MFLFLINLANAAEDLAPQIRYWTNQVNSQVIIATQEPEIFSTLQQTLKKNATLLAVPEVIPKVGDFTFELERLKGKHNLDCLLFFGYDKTKKIEIQTFGDCSPSKNLHFSIDEHQGKWEVYDQSNNPVSVDSFARVCNDYTLQARLTQEDRYLKRNSKILRWSAGTLALASFIPLRNDSIGVSTEEEARLWSFAFLMGSAGLLYFSRDIPAQKVEEEQSSITNYYSRSKVERILAQRFPPIEEGAEAEVTDTNPEDGSIETSQDASKDNALESFEDELQDEPKDKILDAQPSELDTAEEIAEPAEASGEIEDPVPVTSEQKAVDEPESVEEDEAVEPSPEEQKEPINDSDVEKEDGQ